MPNNQPIKIQDLQLRNNVYYAINTTEPYNGPLETTPTFDHKTYDGVIKDGLFNGTYSKSTYDGKKLLETNYKAGNKNGLETQWFATSGVKKSEGNYKDGLEDGLHVVWYENEQNRSEVNWSAGERDGVDIDWHTNGQMSLKQNFKDGQREGFRTTWDRDGNEIESIDYTNKGSTKIQDSLTHIEAETQEFTSGKLTPEQQEFEVNWFKKAAAGIVGRLVKEKALTEARTEDEAQKGKPDIAWRFPN
jgi:antitoxin component YwqK of YwqJK toxin-antitoxin module